MTEQGIPLHEVTLSPLLSRRGLHTIDIIKTIIYDHLHKCTHLSVILDNLLECNLAMI